MVPYYPSPTVPWGWVSDVSSTTGTGYYTITVSYVHHAARPLPIIKPPKNWRWFHAFWPAFDLVRSVQYIEVLIRAAIIRIQERYPVAQRYRHKRKQYVQRLIAA
jgi:hypothetical protein